MRRPLFRFTTRRLMIAVAVIATIFGAVSWVGKMRVRSAAYRQRAVGFEWMTAHARSGYFTPGGRYLDRWDDENVRHKDDWAWQLEAKYLYLVSHPWLDAEPDPAPPEPIPHPKHGLELPEQKRPEGPSAMDWDPPRWTFLWTWRQSGF